MRWNRRRIVCEPSVRRRRGFAMVDLVITVLVMGIMAAVALPRFSNALAKLRAEAVARRIVADLNYARRVALLTSTTVTIAFTSSPPGYQMTGVSDPDRPGTAYAVSIADIDSAVALSAISFNSGPSLSFNVYGRPLVGTTALTAGTVTATSGGYSSTATVDPSLGEASVP